MRLPEIRVVVLFLGIAFAFFPMSAKAASPPQKKEVFSSLNFDQALARAKKEKKVVFIDFYATWCGPCKMLDKTTWQDPNVIAWLNKHTIPLKIDAEKETELAKRYGVRAYPTMVFVKPDGTLVNTLIGYHPAEKFLYKAAAFLKGKDDLALAREEMQGQENNLVKRFQFGRLLAEKGKNEEALNELIWCFDNGRKDQTFLGTRNSMVLPALVQMARTFQPAREALVQRRDEAEKRILAGTEDQWDYFDFPKISEGINQPDAVLRLYDTLKTGDKGERAKRLTHHVLHPLVGAQRYSDILELLPDPLARMTDVERAIDKIRADLVKRGGDPAKVNQALRSIRVGFVDPACISFEALAGQRRNLEAMQLGLRIIAVEENSPEIYKVLIATCIRAGNLPMAKAIAELGKGLETPEARAKIEAAEASIPNKK